jgi:hypothetical protein
MYLFVKTPNTYYYVSHVVGLFYYEYQITHFNSSSCFSIISCFNFRSCSRFCTSSSNNNTSSCIFIASSRAPSWLSLDHQPNLTENSMKCRRKVNMQPRKINGVLIHNLHKSTYQLHLCKRTTFFGTLLHSFANNSAFSAKF